MINGLRMYALWQFCRPPTGKSEESDFIIVDVINQHVALSNLEEGFDDSRYELRLDTIMS